MARGIGDGDALRVRRAFRNGLTEVGADSYYATHSNMYRRRSHYTETGEQRNSRGRS